MRSQSALNLWVKHNGSPAVKVSRKGCKDIDDFAEKVKRKLNTNCPVALFSSLGKKALDPGLSINQFLKRDALKKNSSKIPLFVKLIPAAQDSIAKKTIYIREFRNEYVKYKVKDKEDLRDIYKNSKGLVHLSDPKTVIVSFDEIKDGEKYQVFNFPQTFQSWQKNESDATEAEVLLSMQAFLEKKFQASPMNLSKDFFDKEGRQVQEWDGVLLAKDTLYLLEAKHAMTVEKIKTIAERVKQFPKMIERSSKVFDVKYSKIVGVACGTLFPMDCRDEAHRLGLLAMYPSGSRYRLDEKHIFE
jgi:hypothetical protein